MKKYTFFVLLLLSVALVSCGPSPAQPTPTIETVHQEIRLTLAPESAPSTLHMSVEEKVGNNWQAINWKGIPLPAGVSLGNEKLTIATNSLKGSELKIPFQVSKEATDLRLSAEIPGKNPGRSQEKKIIGSLMGFQLEVTKVSNSLSEITFIGQ